MDSSDSEVLIVSFVEMVLESLSLAYSNRENVLRDVINLRGWYEDFKKGKRQTDVHVDIAFAEGDFVTVDKKPIKFKARLKKVKLVVWLPETDASEFVAGSEKVTVRGPRSIKEGETEKTKGQVGTKGAKVGKAAGSSVKQSYKSPTIEHKFWLASDRVYEWHLSPATDDCLDDRPWMPGKYPLVKVKDQRFNVDDGMPPVVRIAVLCSGEDFEVSPEDEKSWRSLFNSDNARLACLQHIKRKLVEVGLPPNEELETQGYFLIGDITAEAR